MTKAPEHDAEICGLSYELSCHRCRTNFPTCSRLSEYDRANRAWEDLLRRYHRQLDGNPWHRPESLDSEDLGRLAATLLDPHCRPLLRELLLTVLAEPIADAIAAATESQGRAA